MTLKTILETPRVEDTDKYFNDYRIGYELTDKSIINFEHIATLRSSIWLTKSPYENTYMVIDANKKMIVGVVELKQIQIVGYTKTFQIDMFELKKEYRGSGLADLIYSSLVKKIKIKLVTDEVLYKGAEKLWKRLISNSKTKVDYVNIKTGEIDKNISVDDNYFGNGFDYKDKLLILTEDFKGLIPLNYK